MRFCHRCGSPWTDEKRVPSIKEACPACNAYLHCCLNCQHHDPSRHNECRVPNTDAVSRRDGANFCDEFVFREGRRPGGGTDRGAARSTLDSLFGDGDSDRPEEGKSAFDKLFGD